MSDRCKSVTKFYREMPDGELVLAAVVRCGLPVHDEPIPHMSVVADSKPEATVTWHDA